MLDRAGIPTHVAVIMDGNGRWAKARGLSRGEGHKAGVAAVREIITACHDVGVRYLTLYSFSTENWTRPQKEVAGLMALFAETLMKELTALGDKSIRIVLLGDLSALPKRTRKVFETGIDKTKENEGMTLALAVNYGGRQELLGAMQHLAQRVLDGEMNPGDISEEVVASELYTAGLPDPDLLIRTSGEMRVSNFLLWQIAYSEFYVTDILWPDFNRYELLRALLDYQKRARRFGGV